MDTEFITDRPFYVRTDEGIAPMPVLTSWISSGRTLVLHEGKHGKYAVSDYLTGLQICEHKHKATVQKEADQQLDRIAELEGEGSFRWSKHPEINTAEFIQGWNEGMSSEGPRLDGILLALAFRRLR